MLPTPKNIQHSSISASNTKDQPIKVRSIGVDTEEISNVSQQGIINNQMSASDFTLTNRFQGSESEEEEALTDAIEKLIHEFLARPSRRQPYKSVFRWTFNGGPMPAYHVELIIAHSSTST